MPVEVIADPGSTWKADTWEESWRRMCDLMDVTRDAGADVFKPQLLRRGMYQDGTPAAALVGEYEVPDEWLPRLKDECDRRNLELMVTAYRAEDVPLIDPHVKRHKVASFDTANVALLRAIADTGKRVLISTGTQGDREPWRSLRLAWSERGDYHECLARVTPLHCISSYPAEPGQMNLRVLLRENYAGDDNGDIVPGPYKTMYLGLSDHSIGSVAAVIAVAYGATVIEKHIRHDRTHPGNPDYPAAMAPTDFLYYVDAIREAELMLGDGIKRVMPGELVQYRYDPATGRRGQP
ncbi:MAG TPA: N-acetylneuraminate synthase family protein [Rhodothermales bacterium]|nr:N-acetylneuraminate synthase family protein [Rhodothermales bacterium]